MRAGSQYLLAHEPMCVKYTLRESGTSPSSANDTFETLTKIAASDRSSAFADLGGLLKRTSVDHAGRSGSQLFELSLLTHKGQSSFDFRFPKPALREVALTTQTCRSVFYEADIQQLSAYPRHHTNTFGKTRQLRFRDGLQPPLPQTPIGLKVRKPCNSKCLYGTAD